MVSKIISTNIKSTCLKYSRFLVGGIAIDQHVFVHLRVLGLKKKEMYYSFTEKVKENQNKKINNKFSDLQIRNTDQR